MAYSIIAHRADALGANGGTTGTAIDSSGANLIVLAIATDAGVTLVSGDVSDSKGNTYTLVGATYGTTVRTHTFYKAAPTVGSGHTFTVTKTSSFAALASIAASGAHATPLDLEDGANSANSPIQPTTGITPSQANCLVTSAWGESTVGGAVTGPSGYSTPDTVDTSGGSNFGVGFAYLIQTSATFTQPQWAEVGGGSMSTQVVSFKASAASGPTTAQLAGIFDEQRNSSGIIGRVDA